MSCISLAFLEWLLIWLVIVVAIVALLRLLAPYLLAQLGYAGDVVMRALNIFIGAIIAIAVIVLVFELAYCLVGLAPPRLRP